MSYDAWKSTEPDPFADVDPPFDASQRCPVCGADEDEPCEPDCDCQHCQNAAEAQAMRRIENGVTASERDSQERASMAAARLLK